jgi:Cdc6-like AAA superfamily ATPase
VSFRSPLSWLAAWRERAPRPRRGSRFQDGRAASTAIDEPLELVRGILAAGVLSLQRAYCKSIAEDLATTPEFVMLREASGASVFDIRRIVLADQESIFDDTEDARASLFRAAVFAALGAAAGALVAVAVLPVIGTGLRWTSILASVVISGEETLAEHWHWDDAVQASGMPIADLLIGLACLVVLGWMLLRTTAGYARRSATAWRAFKAQARQYVRDRMLAACHEVVNSSDQQVLRLRTAPGLSGQDVDQMVDRVEMASVRALAFDLGAGAIAISGARGVGKTTLLSMLTDTGTESPGRVAFVVNVAAPVKYDSREFLLHLYGELARSVVDQTNAPPRRAWLLRAGALLRKSAADLLVATGAVTVVATLSPQLATWFQGRGVPMPRELPVALLLLVVLWLLARRLGRTSQILSDRLAVEAKRRLEQIRFLQTLAIEHQGTLTRGGLRIGRRWSRQLSEQPLTLPELVASYRQFADVVARWWRSNHDQNGKLLITIDEVDRIVDPELAERFLNELKAIFGTRDCIYVISVSEEALANFERRVVRTRTAFDSAFDDIIRLRTLTVSESVEMLRRRMTGVPDGFLLLCHFIAGGMPRDVVRAARTMLDIHREQPGASTLPEAATKVITREIASVKRGFLAHRGEPAIGAQLLALASADDRWPGSTASELCDSIAEILTHCPVRSWPHAPEAALGAALYFYATVLELFTTHPAIVTALSALVRRPSLLADTPPRQQRIIAPNPEELRQWLNLLQEGEPHDAAESAWALSIAESLGSASRVLPVNPPAAIAILNDFRRELHMPVPDSCRPAQPTLPDPMADPKTRSLVPDGLPGGAARAANSSHDSRHLYGAL